MRIQNRWQLLLITCLFLTAPIMAQAQQYAETYRSIAAGINNASGQAFINLSPGVWETNVVGSKVRWEIEDETLVKTHFAYVGGGLQSASAEFTPMIRITIRQGNKCLSYQVKRIKYDKAGRLLPPRIGANDPDWILDHNCQSVSQLRGILERHLEFSAAPNRLFLGDPFSGPRTNNSLPVPISSNGALQSPRPMVTRIQFFPDVDESGHQLPALRVTFKDATDILLGNGSHLLLKADSGFQFSNLNYFVSEEAADGELELLDLNIYTARLVGGNTTLKLDPPAASEPSHLKLQNLTFSRAQRKIEIENGVISASITEGSELRIAEQEGLPSYLRFASGRINIRGLNLSINDDQPLTFGFNGATLTDLSVNKGQVAMGPQFLTFEHAQLGLELNRCVWGGGGSLVSGTISRLKADVIDGKLMPNKQSSLDIFKGRLSSQSLQIDSSVTPQVTGEFDELVLTLDPGSSLRYPDKFAITPKAGATLTAATHEHPLVFTSQSTFPTGQIEVKLPFSGGEAQIGRIGNFKSKDGNFEGVFQIAPDQPLKGTITALLLTGGTGSFRINQATNMIGVTNARVDASNLELAGKVGLTGKFTEVSFNVPASTSFAIPNSFSLVTRTDVDNPARFEARAPEGELVFQDDLDFPIGKFHVYLPFIRFQTDAAQTYLLSNGDADLTMALDSQGMLSGENCRVAGKLSLTVANNDLTVPIRITNGSFGTEDGVPLFSGRLTTTVPRGVGYNGIKTPYDNTLGHMGADDDLEEAVQFQVELGITLNAPMEIKDAPFSLRGNVVDFEAEASPALTVNVPKKPRGNGGGEHVDRYHPEQGTKNENEVYSEWQEAFIVDVTKPTPDCTAHIYLKDGDYQMSGHVRVKIRNNQFSATISDITTNRRIDVHKDGCDPSILTALIGFTIAGPVGAITGLALGEALDRLLVDQILEPYLTRLLTRTTIKIGPQNLADAKASRRLYGSRRRGLASSFTKRGDGRSPQQQFSY